MRGLILLIFIVLSLNLKGQNKVDTKAPSQTPSEKVEMADALRSSGKIYVVVGVIVLIWAGMLTYLIMIDKKVTQLEKHQKNASEQ